MEINYNQYLNGLEFDTSSENKKEASLLSWCNLLMYVGKVYELKAKNNEKAFNACVDKIKNSKEEWQWIENKLLDKIEDYYFNGHNQIYSNNYNDICIGTLNFLQSVMKECNIENDRLNTLKENFDNLLVSDQIEFTSMKAKEYDDNRRYDERKRNLRESIEEERYN